MYSFASAINFSLRYTPKEIIINLLHHSLFILHNIYLYITLTLLMYVKLTYIKVLWFTFEFLFKRNSFAKTINVTLNITSNEITLNLLHQIFINLHDIYLYITLTLPMFFKLTYIEIQWFPGESLFKQYNFAIAINISLRITSNEITINLLYHIFIIQHDNLSVRNFDNSNVCQTYKHWSSVISL